MTFAANTSWRAARCVGVFVVWLLVSWCAMTWLHELGHIVVGLSCGGTLVSFDLLPWRLPYSLFQPDANPLATLWGGPLLGAGVPIAIAWVLRYDECWFVGWFCVLSNGVYLLLAWVSGDRFLDTPQLLEQGAPWWSIAIYCVVTIVAGYWGFRRACVRLFDRVVSPSDGCH
jgi:hypothetical protein